MVYTTPIVRSDADQLYPDDPVAVIEAESADILQGGYERIPQEPEYDSNDSLSPNETGIGNDNYCPLRGDDQNIDTFFYYIKNPQPPEPRENYEVPLRRKPFSQPIVAEKDTYEAEAGPSKPNILMDDKKVEEVKKIMVNINLPPSCIPKWASDVPEDEWKDFILQKLHLKKSKNYCDDMVE